MLRLDAVYEQMVAHAERAYPEECCGILVGRIDGSQRVVTAARECANLAEDRKRRYRIALEELIDAQREARVTGEHIVGFYHSHPDHPAQPSPTDHHLAYWPECSYFILSVLRGKTSHAASFELRDGKLVPEPHLVANTEQSAASPHL